MASICVLGAAGNRRVVEFASAARTRGLDVDVVSWSELIETPSEALDRIAEATWTRVDSPGEDPRVDQLLCGLAEPLPFGVVPPVDRWFAGFSAALRLLEGAGCGPRLLSGVDDVITAFDKSALHARLSAAGVPVPRSLGGGFMSWDQVAGAMERRRWTRSFVKPRAGSSAVGVVAVGAWHPARAPRAYTTLRLDGAGRPYSALRQRVVTDPGELAALVGAVGAGGLHVEAWYPRAALRGRVLDVRVLVVAGRARHLVVRTSDGPITNLHLGNRRGDADELRAAMGSHWSAVAEIAEAAARCVPSMLHVGVDVLVGSRFDDVVVAEINAFGDLLPGVLHEGRSTYEAEVDALLSGAWAPAPSVSA